MAKAKAAIPATVTIKLVKGTAGLKKIHLDVLNSLGLRKCNDVTIQPVNAATNGKIFKVSHLIEVTNA